MSEPKYLNVRVKLTKINANHTYLVTVNYWALLQETKTDDNVKQINVITTVQSIANTKSNKWTGRNSNQRDMD